MRALGAVVCLCFFGLSCTPMVVLTTGTELGSPMPTGNSFFVVSEVGALLKTDPVEASDLRPAQKCKINAGVKMELARPAMPFGDHYFVELKTQPDSNCSLKVGYIYSKQLAQVQRKFPVDPTAVLDTFDSVASLYSIENTKMEGGAYDRCDYKKAPPEDRRRLSTLEDYLAGKTNWVAIAMDSKVVPYGTMVRIPKLEDQLKAHGMYPGGPIIFVITDGGSAFDGILKWKRFDLCVGDNKDDINKKFNLIDKQSFSMKILHRGVALAPECGTDFRKSFL